MVSGLIYRYGRNVFLKKKKNTHSMVLRALSTLQSANEMRGDFSNSIM